MLSILQKEINSFLNSLVAYIVIGVFLVVTGLYMWFLPGSSVLNYGYADLQALFSIAPWVFLFLIPAITMRSFAEEKKAGTIELLLTRPVTDLQIILGKYFACLLLVIFALLPTLIYYISVYMLGEPKGNIDSAGVTGSYIGLVFLAAVFTAIGIFASSISKDQIISFIIAVLLCFLVYTGFDMLAGINVWGPLAYIISYLGIQYHYETISKGLIDSRDVLYFVSVSALMIVATKLVLESRKW